jgi:hypothetical protein
MINKQIATRIPDLSNIVDMLLLEGSLVECNGLMHGKMGIVIFFFHYAQHTNDKLYEEYAMEFIESVLNDISLKTSVYYRRGLAGIGCAIEYLSQQGFLEIDTDDVFEDLDKCIFDAIMDYRDGDTALFDGLSGLGRYCLHRFRIAKKIPSREKNSMATVKQFIILTVVRILLATLILFVCCCSHRGDGRQSNKIISPVEQTPSMERVIANESNDDKIDNNESDLEAIAKKNNEEKVRNSVDTVSENNNTKTNKAQYEWVDDNGRLTTIEYVDVEVKPLLNGKNGWEEFVVYLSENFNEIEKKAKEYAIQGEYVMFHFFIDTDGSIIDAKIRESTHPELSAEILRLINATQGKWTPGKHEGEFIKVRLVTSFKIK